MHRWPLAIIASCATLIPSIAHGDVVDRGLAAFKLQSAVRKGDAAAAEAMLSPTVRTGALWFHDAACAKQFASPHTLEAAERGQLVKCLIGLTGPDIAWNIPAGLSIRLGTGILIGVSVGADGITALEPIGAAAGDRPILTIHGHALHGKMIEQFSSRTSAYKADAQSSVPAPILRVCTDAAGTLTNSSVLVSSGVSSYDAGALAEAKRWNWSPLHVDGRAVPRCEIINMMMQPPLPPPQRVPQNVAPTMLEQVRKAGERAIVPEDATKVRIQQAGKDKLVGAFKLCIGVSGDVTDVTLIKSTGFSAYDAKIMHTIKTTWSYHPFLINEKPVPVCTAVTFIYSQISPSPRPTQLR
ncbi:MAG: hypothetical protein AB7O24_20795 [Kofleriaceae bacterium]